MQLLQTCMTCRACSVSDLGLGEKECWLEATGLCFFMRACFIKMLSNIFLKRILAGFL